jgi:predicted small secreted protein
MKGSVVLVIMVAALLSACGTLGGAISGAGQDLSKAGDWVKSK